MDGLPEHDEVASAPKIQMDDPDVGPRRSGDSSGGNGCMWWVGGIMAVKFIIAIIAFNAKHQPQKPPEMDFAFDRDGGISLRYTHDIEKIPMHGFDPAGEPVLKFGNDAKCRLVFEYMPPSYVADRSDLGSFSDFDEQLAAAIGVDVDWEDRNTFVLNTVEAETMLKLMDFLKNYPHPEANANAVGNTDEQLLASVCKITATHFDLPANQVVASTSLGELRADDLDMVELVMELEDEFDVTIPDQAIVRSITNGERWDYRTMTMSKLADIVSQQK